MLGEMSAQTNSSKQPEILDVLDSIDAGKRSNGENFAGVGRVQVSLSKQLSEVARQPVLDRNLMRDCLTRLILEKVSTAEKDFDLQNWIKLLMQVQDLKRDAAPSKKGGSEGDPSMEAVKGLDVAGMLQDAE